MKKKNNNNNPYNINSKQESCLTIWVLYTMKRKKKTNKQTIYNKQ